RVVCGRGEKLPIRCAVCDFVLITTTLCFVVDRDRVIAEAKKVLKSNGRIVVGIIERTSHIGKVYEQKKHAEQSFFQEARLCSTEEVANLLLKHGFTNIQILQTLFHKPGSMKKAENPREGFGRGGYVVLYGDVST
ncbi:MAG: methyltransferase domain-containing protein, partial [Elusimicrobia bacterium]|nr:methyltransferase domain-containing protein [Elusimicrobiota bacterium]MBD3412655.1 methyltransferase domain-containing protein [Elusimicrobiota bacterium]